MNRLLILLLLFSCVTVSAGEFQFHSYTMQWSDGHELQSHGNEYPIRLNGPDRERTLVTIAINRRSANPAKSRRKAIEMARERFNEMSGTAAIEVPFKVATLADGSMLAFQGSAETVLDDSNQQAEIRMHVLSYMVLSKDGTHLLSMTVTGLGDAQARHKTLRAMFNSGRWQYPTKGNAVGPNPYLGYVATDLQTAN